MVFKRQIEAVIEEHFKNNDDKILVIDGARQIGKSFIISSVCKRLFKNTVVLNLQDDFNTQKLFEKIDNIQMFYLQLSAIFSSKLSHFEDTIVFLDEIQVYPKLLSMLKELNSDKRYHFIASGSGLGITLKHTFIPMGAIEQRRMYPMNFKEFLWACGVGEDVISYAKDCFDNLKPVDENIHTLLIMHFRNYLICGGLPEAVKAFLNQNIPLLQNIHRQTYTYYKDDASKYDAEHKLKIERIYESLSSYMENKVKRVKLNALENDKWATYSKYEDEFDYLLASGIALGSTAVTEAKYPLRLSLRRNLTKLFYNDVGILSNLLFNNNINAIISQTVNLGSVYETAVASELSSHEHRLFYYDQRKTGEVDFIIDNHNELSSIPIEVKSGRDQGNYRALPNLLSNKEFKIKYGIVLGNKNIVKEENRVRTLPIYMVMFI